MAKPSTETELAEIVARAVADAHHFSCTIQRGSGYQTYRFPTLAEARAYKPTLQAAAANGKLAMVYAITRTGMTHFVPDSFQPLVVRAGAGQ